MQTRGRWIWPVVLNLLVPPLGYFRLRHKQRLLLFGAIQVLFGPLGLLFLWSMPETTWGRAHLALLAALGLVSLTITVVRLIDTVRLTGRHEPEPFLQRGAVWVYIGWILVLVLHSGIIEWLRDRTIRSHSIPSASSEPTVRRGDYLFVRYGIRPNELKHGDLVAYRAGNKRLYLKRLLAKPGDRFRIGVQTQRFGSISLPVTTIYRNGKAAVLLHQGTTTNLGLDLDRQDAVVVLTEELAGRAYTVLEGEFFTSSEGLSRGEFVVPPGKYIVIGDNRDDSRDSRTDGFVAEADIIGRAMYVYWSVNWRDYTCPGALAGRRYPGAGLSSYPCPQDVWSRWKRATIRWQRIGLVPL